MADHPSAEQAQAARGNVPQAANTTYGTANQRIVQGNVSDVKTVKAALLDQGPSFAEMASAVGVVGLVAYQILNDGHKWRVPSTGYEVLVLITVVLHAGFAVAGYFGMKKLTKIALGHVNDMIGQVEKVVADADRLSGSEKARLLTASVSVLAGSAALYAKPEIGWTLGVPLTILVAGLSTPGIVDRLKARKKTGPEGVATNQ